MGFDKKSAATKYTPQDDDTLEQIAERETAAGNPLSAYDITKYNWGTVDADVVLEHLRDELGCYAYDPDKNFLISADVETQSDLLIPKPFTKSGLATDRTHTLKTNKTPAPPKQFEACYKIDGVHFEFDKSFILPSVVGQLQGLEDGLKAHPASKVMVFGHTDHVGSVQYNKDLSDRRALSVYAFITNQPDIWENELYNHPNEKWGIKSVQYILKDMGGPYDPGPVDGINGPLTRTAVENFQRDNGLAVDGIAGPITRTALFDAYMSGKHDIDIGDDRFMDPKHVGCSEYNPVVPASTSGDKTTRDTENAPNRRVTFYLFNEARLPVLPCENGSTGPCEKRLRPEPPPGQTDDLFRCTCYDSIAKDCLKEIGPVPPIIPVERLLELVSVDDHFAPSVEDIQITYKIERLSGQTVTLSVTGKKSGKVVYTHELDDDQKTDGTHTFDWNGEIETSYVTAGGSPYQVQLSADSGEKTKILEFKVLVHSLEMKLGDFEKGIFDNDVSTTKGQQERLKALGYYHDEINGSKSDKFKKAVEWFQSEHDPAAPAKGVVGPTTEAALTDRAKHCIEGGTLPKSGKKKIYVSGAFFFTNDTALSPGGNPRFTAEKAFWGDGLKIPIYTKIYIKKKDDSKVFAPEAVGPQKVLFEWIDGPDDLSILSGKPKDFVTAAVDYFTDLSRPKGDNCHKIRGGKRGDKITKVFPSNSDTAKFPFKVATSVRKAAMVSTASEKEGDELGHAGVIFRPSRFGGDRYKIHAYLHSEKDLDTTAEKKTAPDVEEKTAEMHVWRRVRINQLLRKPHANTNTINMVTINNEMRKAYMEFTGNLTTKDITSAQWTTKITAALSSDPDFAVIGDINYASLNAVDFKSYAAYQTAAGAGALPQPAYTALCRAKVEPWMQRIIEEFAKNQYHGMTIFRVGWGHQTYFRYAGVAMRNGNPWVCWPTSSYASKGIPVEQYGIHESGHCLYMRHHYTTKTPQVWSPTTPTNSDNPLDHDNDDIACVMGYQSLPWHFCGLCILKLRGWNESALSMTDADNKKP